jgi:hypothetical protein
LAVKAVAQNAPGGKTIRWREGSQGLASPTSALLRARY